MARPGGKNKVLLLLQTVFDGLIYLSGEFGSHNYMYVSLMSHIFVLDETRLIDREVSFTNGFGPLNVY